MKNSQLLIQKMDEDDPLAGLRDLFDLPHDKIYLDGNSLGPLPHAVRTRMADIVSREWGLDLIQSWNKNNWINLPRLVAAKIAPLIGANPDEVMVCDSTSVNLFKLIGYALGLQPGRNQILSSQNNFPTDLYMVQGMEQLLGTTRCQLIQSKPDELLEMINERTAAVMLTHVDFRSGELLDIEKITQIAHEHGALVLWDLSHSTGVIPVDLRGIEADLAVGCGYKYLNGGPGAPAYLYVAKRLQGQSSQPLWGWMGHNQPFEFDPGYHGAEDIGHFLTGTPAILSLAALDEALDIWTLVNTTMTRQKSVALTSLFIELVQQRPALSSFTLASPRDADQRGSQVSLSHPDAYAIMQALIDKGVIGDFREPDLLRFGMAPLYTRYTDIYKTVDILEMIMTEKHYLAARFQTRQKVT